MDSLDAITPMDGRYREKLSEMENYFSEYALMKERVRIEIEYLVKFLEEVETEKVKTLPDKWKEELRKIYENFSKDEAVRIKEIEKIVGHDVFAVVKYIMDKFEASKFEALKPYVHLGLTSEDINNLAYSLLLKKFNQEILVPSLLELIDKLLVLSTQNINTLMLGRTHGVPAVPTTFGRFLINYAYRIAKISEELVCMRFPGKLGGAVGDFNALKFLYPNVDWILFSKSFVESLELRYFPAFTQILPHDQLSEYLMKVALLASILSNLCRDLWMFSMMGYISFSSSKKEVHSSTMPHKSNPLLLENAEGSFDFASNSLSFIAKRLISSRLHRDLSDSVIKRFYGLPLSLTYLGIKNLVAAMEKIQINKEEMLSDLKKHPEILSEAYQLYLRRIGYYEGYEVVQKIVRENPGKIIEELKKILPNEKLKEIEELSFEKYVGESKRIVEFLVGEVEKIKDKIKSVSNNL
jgi:adenylosuccinate lyase